MHATEVTSSVTRELDSAGFGRYQCFVVFVCALIAMLDGFDTQVIGFLAPSIAADWKVPLPAFGPVFSIGLFGGLLGAVIFGNLADRIGRRRVLIITVCLFAIGSIGTAAAGSLVSLTAGRFVTSLGLGGAMPSIIVLTSEYVPARVRATIVTAMFCGFPLGAVVGALMTSKIVAAFGWPAVFLLGGALPLALLPLLIISIPESMQWLAARQRVGEIAAILRRINPGRVDSMIVQDGLTAPLQQAALRPGLLELFRNKRAIGSLLLAVLFFCSLLLVFVLVSWIPTLAVKSAYTVQSGVRAAALLNGAGIIGALILGRFSDRFGVTGTVGIAYCLGGLAITLLTIAGPAANSLFLFCAIAGFTCVGSQLCAVSIAAQYYPPALRATGVGWCMGTGRFGSIAGPLVGAALLDGANVATHFFLLVAIVAGIAGVTVLTFGISSGTLFAARK